jgi:2-desacetyl-2-hydroxyethyl bacteriochlorophyllide A dehydrogenase|tara:strand:- start:260 stop:1285 length:1026 start_codon:yes stop_codon:yes gene_type:complete
MKTIQLETPGKFRKIEEAEPQRQPGEALVRVHRIGVCGTDIHAFHGRQPFFEYPRILGHELGVEILEIDDNEQGLQAGDRCSVEPYMNDVDSPASISGKSNCCENLSVIGVHSDGGMRPFITVPVQKLHKSNALSYEQLALIETICIGAHGIERSMLKDGENILVIGTGPIGLGAIQFAMSLGSKVIVADISEERLAFCRDVIKVDHVLKADDPEFENQLRSACNGHLPQVVLDATGNRFSMQRAFTLAAHGGRIVFVGLLMGNIAFDDPNFHKRELTLMASRNATPDTFKKVIAAVENGAIDTEPWITHRLDFLDVPDKFETTIAEPKLIKAIINTEQES